jgi:hypothetical protein
MTRDVAVDWVAREEGGPRQVVCTVGWSGIPLYTGPLCVKLRFTRNGHAITEGAAIGVMSLLLHHLEGAEITEVAQIGRGGDYLVSIRGLPEMQAESSGIAEDEHGYRSRERLKEKCVQVLKRCPAGFAAVVTFRHADAREVHCYLSHVAVPNRAET